MAHPSQLSSGGGNRSTANHRLLHRHCCPRPLGGRAGGDVVGFLVCHLRWERNRLSSEQPRGSRLNRVSLCQQVSLSARFTDLRDAHRPRPDVPGSWAPAAPLQKQAPSLLLSLLPSVKRGFRDLLKNLAST